jgi:hypothetical protein
MGVGYGVFVGLITAAVYSARFGWAFPVVVAMAGCRDRVRVVIRFSPWSQLQPFVE